MDGTRRGFDLELTNTISSQVSIPVIASGGPGNPNHIIDGFIKGQADAVALGSILHFELSTIKEVNIALINAGVSVRPL